MAINWIFALKAVPWADVVQAAPSIVKGARKLFNNARSSEPPPVGPEEFHPGADGGSTHARLRAVEVALRNLDAEQDSTAELIRSLAEQNARVVEAIEVLRGRMRVLLGISLTLSVAFVVAVIWLLTQ